MKKLLSAITISFVLSGCMNNISLPNTNIQEVVSNSDELNYLGFVLGTADVCKHVNPKMEKKWDRYIEKALKIANSYNKNDKEYILASSVSRVASPYMRKNNIPLTLENFENIYKQQFQDKYLKKAIYKAAVADLKGTDLCFTPNIAEKSLKEFANKFGKGHLL